jgi:PKD repeat protein
VDHTFDRAGTYEALFRGTDPDGASTTLQVEVTVENMAPEITLTLDRTYIETGGSVNFSVEVYDTPSDMGEHFITWEFGDGGTSHEYSGIHAFPSNGTYVVRVTVEDDDGAIAIASTSVTVTDPPKAPEDPTDDDPSPDDGVGNTIYLVAGVLAAALMVVVLVFYLMRRDGGTGLADELDAEPPSEGPDQG